MLIEVWGPRAAFVTPTKKDEPMTYPIITPSAARGIMDAIYRCPEMEWVVDRIYCLSPYPVTKRQYVVASVPEKTSPQKMLKAYNGQAELPVLDESRTLQTLEELIDVHYVLDVHFNLKEDVLFDQGFSGAAFHAVANKINAIVKRRLRDGKATRTPYLGRSEYIAFVAPYFGTPKCDPSWNGTKEITAMLYDIAYNVEEGTSKGIFFNARVENGVLDLVKYRKENWWKKEGAA